MHARGRCGNARLSRRQEDTRSVVLYRLGYPDGLIAPLASGDPTLGLNPVYHADRTKDEKAPLNTRGDKKIDDYDKWRFDALDHRPEVTIKFEPKTGGVIKIDCAASNSGLTSSAHRCSEFGSTTRKHQLSRNWADQTDKSSMRGRRPRRHRDRDHTCKRARLRNVVVNTEGRPERHYATLSQSSARTRPLSATTQWNVETGRFMAKTPRPWQPSRRRWRRPGFNSLTARSRGCDCVSQRVSQIREFAP
jgi:hypothetical protein